LNSSGLDIPEILMLTHQEAKKTHKVELATIVTLMNNRGLIRAEQRAGRKRTRASREEESIFADEDRPGERSSSRVLPGLLAELVLSAV
jgi:hypothetical protein